VIPYLDWAALALTLGQMYFLGRRRSVGWPVGLAGNGLWITWSLEHNLWSVVAINAVLACLAVKGWLGWRGAPPEEGGERDAGAAVSGPP
jgi:nicotinamide mononucleotide transporter